MTSLERKHEIRNSKSFGFAAIGIQNLFRISGFVLSFGSLSTIAAAAISGYGRDDDRDPGPRR